MPLPESSASWARGTGVPQRAQMAPSTSKSERLAGSSLPRPNSLSRNPMSLRSLTNFQASLTTRRTIFQKKVWARFPKRRLRVYVSAYRRRSWMCWRAIVPPSMLSKRRSPGRTNTSLDPRRPPPRDASRASTELGRTSPVGSFLIEGSRNLTVGRKKDPPTVGRPRRIVV